MRALTLTAAVLVLAVPSLGQYDSGAYEPIPRLKGTVFACGGGELPTIVYQRFVELCGGAQARIVVLSGDEMDATGRLRFTAHGVTDENLKSKREEMTRALVENATGVWIEGDDPVAFADGFRAFEEPLKALIAKGHIVGANGPVVRALARAMLEEDKSGLDIVPGSVIDDAYTSKKNEPLLAAVKARPTLVGLGIDAGTAMVLHRRFIDVIGNGSVHALVAANTKRPLRVDRINRQESPASQRRPGSRPRVRNGRRGPRGRRNNNADRGYRPRRLGDLISLSRSAQARVYPKFPGYKPDAPHVEKGTLIIVGGGGMPDGLMKKFIDLAGGPDAPLVYVPCEERESLARPPRLLEQWKRLGCKDVDWIHTKDRKAANEDEAILTKMKRAKGVWFGGGRQWNFVDSYQNTKVHELMHDVLARGGVIGGSSAGASIQASYMARGNPLGNVDSMAEGYEVGLGFLTGVAIDQHFTQRGRLPDMTALVNTYPELLGIGIDETASIIVRGTVAEVFSRPGRNVLFYDRRIPVEQGKKDHLALGHGQRYDLKSRKIVDPK